MIYPGLPKPKSQLFFDIQAMIADNGGRFKLATEIENEWLNNYHIHLKTKQNPYYSHLEIEYIKANYKEVSYKELAAHLDRSIGSINIILWSLYKKGLPYKYPKIAKNNFRKPPLF